MGITSILILVVLGLALAGQVPLDPGWALGLVVVLILFWAMRPRRK